MNDIKDIIKKLNNASAAYYNTGKTIMTDKEYDKYFDMVKKYEEETGIIYANSPTHKVGSEIVSKQEKVKHTRPMLSLEKCHTAKEICEFSNKHDLLAMFKMDGMSMRATYDGKTGRLIGLSSRGNGEIGANIFYHRHSFINLPTYIPVRNDDVIEIDGEAIITENDFEEINKRLNKEDKFSNSRNLVAGTLSLLDSNISKLRSLRFIVWDVVSGTDLALLSEKLKWANKIGFDVVDKIIVPYEDIDKFGLDFIDKLNNTMVNNAKALYYPIDGIVWKYNSCKYGDSMGRTTHHFKNGIAWKPENNKEETILRDIEWSMGKSGVLSPVAIFDPVIIDGAEITRSTLHNITYIKNLKLGIGDRIGVVRANMVIPRVEENYTKSNTANIPNKCPICGGDTIVKKDNDVEILMCTNPTCTGKVIGKLCQFVSKEAINIDGLSEQTLIRLNQLGLISSYKDIYYLKDYANKLINLDGFGATSVDKMLNAIEKSRTTTLSRFLYSLSCPLLGRKASKTIEKAIIKSYAGHNPFNVFMNMINRGFDFRKLEDFGDKLYSSIVSFFKDNEWVVDLAHEFDFDTGIMPMPITGKDLTGMTFVVTGSVHVYKNRKEIEDEITSKNGKVSGTVSKNTTYLMCNEESSSSKYVKAKQLGIPIITEEELIKLIRE